jgi:eukaryotic-like serine/threonine-protein kinase
LALAVLHLGEEPLARQTTRFQIVAPQSATALDFPTVSPDGRRVAFVGTLDGKPLLWVRSFDSLTAKPLAGTAEATFPFWSPDSRFIAFFSQGNLKSIDTSGGPVQTLCAADTPGRGGTWSRDGTIVFGANLGPLRRVAAAGGVPTVVTTVGNGTEQSHRYPQFLPDGRHFLYWLQAADAEKSGIVVGSLDDKPDAKERRHLLASRSMAVYSAGHLLFDRAGTVMGQRFDASRLNLQGDAFPVVQDSFEIYGGRMRLSASSEGTLTYVIGDLKTQLAWFDRQGKALSQLGAPEQQGTPRLSPDQKKVAVFRRDSMGRNDDIWLLDLARDTSTRLTFHASSDMYPVWSPNGDRIVFTSGRAGFMNLYQKALGGSADEQPLLKSAEFQIATDWSSDGRFILYQILQPKRANDLWILPVDHGGPKQAVPAPLLHTEFNETWGQFSPDGHWIAYESNESGRNQVYVMAFPEPGGRVQVSTAGGSHPRWRRDGKELFYINPDNKMIAVDVKANGQQLDLGRPQELFETRAQRLGLPTYDVTANGQRFLINAAAGAEGAPSITVVMNWNPKTR